MGFLSFFVDTVSAVADKVKEVVEDIVLEVECKIDEIKSKFGRRKSYDGSVAQSIDIEKELADFREKIGKEAEKLEKAKTEEVIIGFDSFIGCLKDTYPELVLVLEEKKRNIIKSIKGTIINEIKKYISENDPEFRSVLEMTPGVPKTKKIGEKMTEELKKAEKKFDNKLEKKMKELNNELETRLLDELQKKEDILQKETEMYEELEKDHLRGQVDIDKQRANYVYAVEIKNCLEKILAGVN